MATLAAIFGSAVLILSLGSAAVFASDELAKEVLSEMNLARTSPAKYAEHIRQLRRHFKGKVLQLPGSDVRIHTAEGTGAVDEAIGHLRRQRAVPPLAWSPGLAEAAADLLQEQGKSGATGHTGTSGGVRERIDRHGDWSGRIAENIGYGPKTARLMVMQLIIDDAVPDRGHRKNIFDASLRLAGVACGPHPEYGTMCVTDFATKFKKK